MEFWHYEQNNETVGPVPTRAVIAAIKAGQIDASTRVWNPKLSEWIALSESTLAPNLPNHSAKRTGDRHWCYELYGEQFTGVRLSTVKRKYSAGVITKDTRVIPPGENTWVPFDATELYWALSKEEGKNPFLYRAVVSSLLTALVLFMFFVTDDPLLFALFIPVLLNFAFGTVQSIGAALHEVTSESRGTARPLFVSLVLAFGHVSLIFYYIVTVDASLWA